MIVWVSSFPRSGNSLAKLIFGSVFLQYGTSRYRSLDMAKLAAQAHGPSRPASGSPRGFYSFDFAGPWEEFRAAAHAAPHEIYIKTHEPADDDSRAVYVVRDPRAALVSYYHFLRFNHPELAMTQEDVIRGSVGYGSWSAHLDSWQPVQRPGTLLMRYEDMIDNSDAVIASLAKFVGAPPLRPWRNQFQELNLIRPEFFRSGSNVRDMRELSASQLDLVRAVHGPWMRRLGYDPE
jgi:hypothetical protein